MKVAITDSKTRPSLMMGLLFVEPQQKFGERVVKRCKCEKNKIFSPVRVLLPPVIGQGQGC